MTWSSATSYRPSPWLPGSTRRSTTTSWAAGGNPVVIDVSAVAVVDGATEGVHDGVQIGAYSQPEEVDVVTCVSDHGDYGVGQGGRAVEVGTQATQEACSAHSTREGGDAHERSLSGRDLALGSGPAQG